MVRPTQGQEEVPMEEEESSTPVHHDGIPDYEPIVVAPAPENVGDFDHSGPRLMITHIENENFKSYAGTQILGPFHKSFSSIVGPNGSGKSNVIDSMLFVFGFRAQKIRSKKISVLIHNSDGHHNINSCTVAVHFQKIVDTGMGDNDFEVVPDSKFVVSRTAFRDNSSYYKVNDKKSTYKEVGVLLRSQGIDLDHDRFLILQGQVEQIAMMKPKAPNEHEDGMLEFLEDIIGSSRFKTPIAQLSGRVETLNDLRGEKLNRVKVVEKEKDDLEGVKDEALQYLTIENDIVKKKNMLYQKYVCECAENEEKATKKRDEIQDGMKDLNEKVDELNQQKKEKTRECKKIHKQHEELAKKSEETKAKFAEYEQQDVRCREDLKHTKGKAKKLKKTLEQEQKKLEELKQIPEKSERDVAEFKKKLDKLEADKAKEEEKLKEVMDSLKTETQGLQEEKDSKEQDLLELNKAKNETKSKYNVAQSELDMYISRQQSEEAKLNETRRNLEKASATLKDRKKAIQDISARFPESEQQLEKVQKDLKEATEAEAKISEKVKQTRVKVEEARSSLQSAKTHSKVLDALMSLKRSGRMPGIYGRLGDLGAIDEKYDVAISTACGPLDNIVVDSIDTAQQCVQFLKTNNVGLATFIALDKMSRWKPHCAKTITTPENVPRLFDLVKVKDKDVLPAFYFAVRDTLVAKDLDQATRIAYGRQRFRVVTLGGQLIDQSGTMSGGGSKVCKGRMGSSLVVDVDPDKLKQMESQLEKDSDQIQKVRETKMLLADKVEKLTTTLRDMKHALEKFTMETESLAEQETNLKTQMKEQEAQVKAAAPDQKKLKDMEKNVASFKKDFEKATAAVNEVEDEVHQLHKRIMDIGGNKLKAVETRLQLINTQIDQITGHITKAQVSVKTAQRNAKKSEDKAKNIEEEILENQNKMEELEKEFKTLEEDAGKVLEAYQNAADQMKVVEEELRKAKEEVDKIEQEEQELQKEHIEVKHQLDNYQGVVKENQQKIKYWKKELGKLKLHQIDSETTEEMPVMSPEELHELSKEETQYGITVLEEKLSQMKPNMAAIAEYRKKEEAYLKRVGELDQITELRDQQRKQLEDLRKQRLEEFMAAFTVITNKLKEMYQMITLGGDAELELVDSLDPFSEGIVFSVRPPKKSWKNISNLSGGEKTLSSLALVFALHHFKPTPLYVMDEIDAALDFKNVSIVANYIKERTKNAQFIIISLRDNMFELADRLIGIYKTYDCTKSVTIDPKKITMPQVASELAAQVMEEQKA